MSDLFCNVFLMILEITNYRWIYLRLNKQEMRSTKKVIIISVLYACTLGVVRTFTNDSLFLVLVHLVLILTVHLVSRRRIYDSFLVYIIMIVLLGGVQFLTLFVAYIPNVDSEVLIILGQILTTFFVAILCKFPLYNLLNVVQRVLLTRYLFYILCGIVFAVLLISNFDHGRIRPYYAFILIIIAICCKGFMELSKEIIYFTEHIARKEHDAKNEKIRLINAIARIQEITDQEELNAAKEIKTYINSLNLDINNYAIPVKTRNNIHDFIFYKENYDAKKKGISLIVRPMKYEHNLLVSEGDIIIMLGILLDNAIEASCNQKPVLIYVYVDMDIIKINVGNEFIEGMNLKRIFEKGYSTKGRRGHGFGLYNLKKIVEKKYKGEIVREFCYEKDYLSEYIFFKINIEDCVRKSRL